MCVTNTTHRRVQAVTLTPSQIGVCPSALSQRLLGAISTVSSSGSSTNKPQHFFPLPAACSNSASEQHPFYQHQNHATVSVGVPEKPKRRRKPQKPGLTAKMNERHFVVHSYHDHAMDPLEDYMNDHHHDHHHHSSSDNDNEDKRRGGVSMAFPLKLHAVLDQVERDGLSHVVSWSQHGRCFVIYQPKEFVETVMPRYFRQSKLTSFQRQLNLYGFARLTRGPDAGGYYHELFLRNREFLCKKMTRTKVKGTRFKAASSPESEPDFYSMPPVMVVTPHHSSDEEEDMSFASSSQQQRTITMEYSMLPQEAVATAQIPMYASYPVQSSSAPAAPQLSPIPLSFATFASSSGSSMLPMSISSSAQYHQPQFASSSLFGSDQILDDAVDELFLNELEEQDNLTDFVTDWDPSSSSFGQGDLLNDDAQLGFMLEKLLED